MRRATRVLIGAGAVLALLAGAADPAAARPPTLHAPALQAAFDAIRDVPTMPGQQEGGYGLGIAGGRLDCGIEVVLTAMMGRLTS
jgi:hypothetical protein